MISIILGLLQLLTGIVLLRYIRRLGHLSRQNAPVPAPPAPDPATREFQEGLCNILGYDPFARKEDDL